MAYKKDDFSYEIVEALGTLSEGTKGWTKEVNVVSWNGRDGKLDIRDWDSDHQKMGKGLTLTYDEGRELLNILKQYYEQ